MKLKQKFGELLSSCKNSFGLFTFSVFYLISVQKAIPAVPSACQIELKRR